MKNFIAIISILVALVSLVGAKPDKTSKSKMNSKDEFTEKLGKEITLTGIAENDPKIGARLMGSEISRIYIQNLENWPKEAYGKKVTVTGTLIEKHDLPVYIPKNQNDIRSGIIVQKGTDLHAASHRYLLKDAKWEIVKE